MIIKCNTRFNSSGEERVVKYYRRMASKLQCGNIENLSYK